MTQKKKHILLLIIIIFMMASFPSWAAKQTHSKLYLNGTLVSVSWSDGDTFRVLQGAHRGAKARLMGFNTLESYGPVHKWGRWTARELAANADQATHFVKRGVWHCQTHGKKDHYHRILVSCQDLAKALVSRGLAHVFGPPKRATKSLLKLQRRAQKLRKGMWAKGIPPFLLTSVHSTSEGKRPAYNRIISTSTGAWKVLRHNHRYRTCQWVCMKGSCLRYVPYKQRYGSKRARCLRRK